MHRRDRQYRVVQTVVVVVVVVVAAVLSLGKRVKLEAAVVVATERVNRDREVVTFALHSSVVHMAAHQ